MEAQNVEIGVDIGGTFTDVVAVDADGRLRLAKVPSTRSDPSAAVRSVFAELLPEWQIEPRRLNRFVHGTTVATNAVLERKGARLGVLATEGFTDILEIGRQNRRQIYDLILKPETPAFLAPGAFRKGVVESIGPRGEVIMPLDEGSLKRSVDALAADGVEAIAICFLFSFVNPAHERIAADYIRRFHPKLFVSLSSEVDPAFREYERTCVTAFDAYVKPGLDRYLGDMERDLRGAGMSGPLQIMQSRGGICSSHIARQRPIRLFLSGPAAGVIGARAVGASVGHDDLITVDIGGTSSDIALIAKGQPVIRPEGLLDGFRIRVPMVDVNSIGAGGGSIAWIDAAGGLRVGPRSAGAEPGPACYDRGGQDATVTDASIVLGLLDPKYFAGGTLELNPELAARAIDSRVAQPLGLSLRQAALGIHRVVNAQMAEGIRLVSISRGIDPRRFSLLAFGGAGALHATALADELGIQTIIIPRYPGVLSASGLLAAPIEHEVSAAYLRRFVEVDPGDVIRVCRRLTEECAARMREEGDTGVVETSYYADVCYVGQAHHIEVPISLEDATILVDATYKDFCLLYENVYGHHTASPARFVNLRAVQRTVNRVTPRAASAAATSSARKGVRKILVNGMNDHVEAQIYDRDGLSPADIVTGPAIVEQSDTTVLIEPGWHARVTDNHVLLLTKEG
jgi:N-methylhydantoinase A